MATAPTIRSEPGDSSENPGTDEGTATLEQLTAAFGEVVRSRPSGGKKKRGGGRKSRHKPTAETLAAARAQASKATKPSVQRTPEVLTDTKELEDAKQVLEERIAEIREQFEGALPYVNSGSYLYRLLHEPVNTLIESLMRDGRDVKTELNACRIMMAQLNDGSSLNKALVHLLENGERATQRIAAKVTAVEELRQKRINAFGEGLALVNEGSYLNSLLTQPVEALAQSMVDADGNVKDLDSALGILRHQLRLDGKLMTALQVLDKKARASKKRVESIDSSNRGKSGTSKASKKAKQPATPKVRGTGPQIGKPNPQGPADPKRLRRGGVGVNAKGEKAGTKGARRRSKVKK